VKKLVKISHLYYDHKSYVYLESRHKVEYHWGLQRWRACSCWELKCCCDDSVKSIDLIWGMYWLTCQDGATKLSMMTLSITTLSITTLSIKWLFATFSIMTIDTTTVCRYAECHVLFIVMLNVIMLSVTAPLGSLFWSISEEKTLSRMVS
jgi:hypothetical protein